MAAPHSTKARPSRAKSGAVRRTTRRQITVDDLTGQTAATAIELARAAGLRPAPERVEVDDQAMHGLVVGHDPKGGETATRGSLLALFVGAAPAEAQGEPDANLPPDDFEPGAPDATGSETEFGLPPADDPEPDEAGYASAETDRKVDEHAVPEPPFTLLDPFFDAAPQPLQRARVPRRRRGLIAIVAGVALLGLLLLASAVAHHPQTIATHGARPHAAPRTRPHHLRTRHRHVHRASVRARRPRIARKDAAQPLPAAPTHVYVRAAIPAPALPQRPFPPTSPEDDEFFGG